MTGYRIIFSGPGFLTGTIGTDTREVCERAAPGMARVIKADTGVRWIAWKIVASK